MKQLTFEITNNFMIAENVFRMTLSGDTSGLKAGQFINIKLDGLYLRRPISVCDVDGDTLTIIYKVVGKGTDEMSGYPVGKKLDVLSCLGNGYDLSLSGEKPLLIGGGVGVPPLYFAAKKLVEAGKSVTAILGYNTVNDVFLTKEFENLGVKVLVTTADGSFGIKGFVTDALKAAPDYDYFFTCGPEPMLKAVYAATKTSGQFSFEERMGCGFGACMGCSCKTVTGYKRICKDGPVLFKEEILWKLP